jgi:myo-inositol-1(or 4)-monophosphatase
MEPVVTALGEPAWRVEGIGSTAWKMACVAAGRADAFVARGPRSEWDVCAGSLIVEMAGGRSTDLRDRPFHFNRARTGMRGTVATNGHFHQALIEAIAVAGYVD